MWKSAKITRAEIIDLTSDQRNELFKQKGVPVGNDEYLIHVRWIDENTAEWKWMEKTEVPNGDAFSV